MLTRDHFNAAGFLEVRGRRHAVVVGGSMAGMLAARVLSDHFDGVTLLERDRFPETPTARKGYASRLYRPPARARADWKALYIQQAPPDDPRGGLVSPVEGGLWLVSLVGGDGDYPPVDEAGFLDFARSLRSRRSTR